jgi:hypothetical protein
MGFVVGAEGLLIRNALPTLPRDPSSSKTIKNPICSDWAGTIGGR